MEAHKRPGIWWHVYGVLTALAQAPGLKLLAIGFWDTRGAITYLSTILGCVGLYGYVRQRRVLAAVVWQYWWLVLPCLQLVQTGVALEKTESGGELVVIANFAWMFPLFVALFRYARSPLWE